VKGGRDEKNNWRIEEDSKGGRTTCSFRTRNAKKGDLQPQGHPKGVCEEGPREKMEQARHAASGTAKESGRRWGGQEL